MTGVLSISLLPRDLWEVSSEVSLFYTHTTHPLIWNMEENLLDSREGMKPLLVF